MNLWIYIIDHNKSSIVCVWINQKAQSLDGLKSNSTEEVFTQTSVTRQVQ